MARRVPGARARMGRTLARAPSNMQRDTFAPDLESLLAPIGGANPCGASVRYDAAYLLLRGSREEDDASLPMREWERPLKKADWRGVANECAAMLGKSKDLQLAAWLCDAWVRQYSIEGLNAGADLLLQMVERYWDCLHPQIEEGDSDARVAPFMWMNEDLPLTLRLNVPLVFVADRKPPTLNLADWEQVVAGTPREHKEGKEPGFTREQLIAMVDTRNLHWLSDLDAQLDASLQKWDALARALDERLALDAPSLGKVAETLRKLQRACVSLMDARNPRAPAATPAPATQPPVAREPEEPAMTETHSAATQADTPLPTGPIGSRQEAYRMLEAAAAYLQRTEPHSPTPYLVKRAVTWGQMSLADVMQEILREDGDLSRYFALLGINPPRE